MRETFTDDVQFALELIPGKIFCSTYKQLLDHRLGCSGGWADVGAHRINRHQSPSDQGLTFFSNNSVNRVTAELTFFADLRQEDVAHRIFARAGQSCLEVIQSNVRKKRMRQRHQNAGTVAGIRFKAATSAVIHPRIQVICIKHNLVTGSSLDVRNESYAAGVFLVCRIVQTGLLRKAKLMLGLGLISHCR